jgi:predicted adenylyl cyclase CyaB
MSDTLLTIKEAAKRLNVHWQTVRNYIKDGKLNSYKIGRNVRIRENDLRKFIRDKSQADKKYEVEIRFVADDKKSIQERLIDLDAEITYHGHIIDHWFVPNRIKNLEQKDKWFNSARGYGLRIREQDNGYTGKIITSLEVKRLVEADHHEQCVEQEIDVDNYEETYKLLKLANFKEFIEIDKDRLIYKYKGANIVIDSIKNFLVAVEIEVQSNSDRDELVEELKSIAKEIGLDPEEDITDKSVTFLAMEEMAEF